MSLYEKIKALCKEKGISIYECEKRAGLGNGVIGGWQKSIPMFNKIEAVARVLEVPVDYFTEEQK